MSSDGVRYAFLREQGDSTHAVIVTVIHTETCKSKDDLDSCLNEWLGVDRPVQPFYTKVPLS